MKGDKFVIGVLLDSMIMNLGDGASVSLSQEFKLRLNFLVWERSHIFYVFHWFYAPPPTTESNLRREWTKGKTHSPWMRQGIQYKYAHIKSKISSLCKILAFITQSNRVQKLFPLNTFDLHPPPSSTYQIKGWALFRKSRLDYTFGRK